MLMILYYIHYFIFRSDLHIVCCYFLGSKSSSSSSSKKGKDTTSQQERMASQPTATATAGASVKSVTTVSVAEKPNRYFLCAVFIIKTSSLPIQYGLYIYNMVV
jgi:hypothetical protein